MCSRHHYRMSNIECELTFIHRVSVKDANLTNIFLDILALLYWLANVSQGSNASRVNSVYI